MKLAAWALLFSRCSSSSSPAPTPSAPLPLFGDDRVADVLMRDPSRAPTTLIDHEHIFGVGRACDDVFVVEEAATRKNNQTLAMDRVVPRVVYGPCRAGLTADLFTVVPTDPDRPATDPLVQTTIETMALDRTTKTYGFYVFDATGVTRIFADGANVRTIVGARDGSVREVTDGDRRCFSCHVHAEPLMPTPARPWTNWVSSLHPKAATYEGETQSIVSKAAQADDFEPMVRNAVRAMVVSGAGDVRSLFCATTVQFATGPMALYVDPGAIAGSSIVKPALDAPSLVPVRADWDLRVEAEWVNRGTVSAETIIALRLIDDANDAFSPTRCALMPSKFENDAQLRTIVRGALSGRTDLAAVYARALLGDGEGDVASARAAYFDSVRARIAATDMATLTSRTSERRLAARALFPGPSHPIPIAALP